MIIDYNNLDYKEGKVFYQGTVLQSEDGGKVSLNGALILFKNVPETAPDWAKNNEYKYTASTDTKAVEKPVSDYEKKLAKLTRDIETAEGKRDLALEKLESDYKEKKKQIKNRYSKIIKSLQADVKTLQKSKEIADVKSFMETVKKNPVLLKAFEDSRK